MALHSTTLTAIASTSLPAEARGPFTRLIEAIASRGSVKRIGITREGAQVDLWVLLHEEVEGDEDAIIDAEYAYHRAEGAYPLDLHVFSVREVDERNLPEMATLYP